MHSKKMEKEKSVIYLGNYYGFGKSYGGGTNHYKGIMPTLLATSGHGGMALVLRKWRESESSKQQKRDGLNAESQE